MRIALPIIGAASSVRGQMPRNTLIAFTSFSDIRLKKCPSVIPSTRAAPIRDTNNTEIIIIRGVEAVKRPIAANDNPATNESGEHQFFIAENAVGEQTGRDTD